MARLFLAIYRLPTARATQVGAMRVVVDRHQQLYMDGSKVVTADPSGDFLILTLANGQVYYVKAREYEQLRTNRGTRH
jgi:hypothetical protein